MQIPVFIIIRHNVVGWWKRKLYIRTEIFDAVIGFSVKFKKIFFICKTKKFRTGIGLVPESEFPVLNDINTIAVTDMM